MSAKDDSDQVSGPDGGRPDGPAPTGRGPGRVLVAIYGVFALSATVRAGVQIARDFAEAPVAYLLSAVAAVVYILATVALARGDRTSRVVAWSACTFELVGVLVVGTLSLAEPELFPRATVWSGFGQGYGYVPLVLPILGLLWLWRTGRAGRSVGSGRSS